MLAALGLEIKGFVVALKPHFHPKYSELLYKGLKMFLQLLSVSLFTVVLRP